MRAVVFITGLLLLSCGAVKPRPERVPSDEERGARAYLVEGDGETAARLLKTAAEDTGSPGAAFLLADLLDVTGRPAEALPYYFKVLSTAHEKGGNPDAAVAAAMGVVTIRERVERFNEQFEAFYKGLGGGKGELPAEAWYQLTNLRFGLLRREGRVEAAAALSTMGCPRVWQTVGPFGPWIWSAFDGRNEAVEQQSVWPDALDLGQGRGTSAPQTVEGESCYVELFNPELPLSGVTWAKTVLSGTRAGKVSVRLQTSAAVSVRFNGEEVFRRDTREAFVPSVSWFEADLPRGEVEIMVKLATRGLPSFSMVLQKRDGAPAFQSASPLTEARFKRPKFPVDPRKAAQAAAEAREAEQEERPPETRPAIQVASLTEAYARLKVALFWDDITLARELMDAMATRWKRLGPVLLQSMAEAAAADAALPGDVAYERARRLHSAALKSAPALWQSRIALADRDLDEDRIQKALALLQEGLEVSPGEPQLLRRLSQTFLSYQWFAEASESIGRLAKLLPTACNTYAWQLSLARQRSGFGEMHRLAEKIRGCDAFSKTLQDDHILAQRWKAALTEAERLAAQSPRNAATCLDLVGAATSAGDDAATIRAAKRALALAPVNPSVVLSLADATAASGDDTRARAVLEEGLAYVLARKPTLLDSMSALDGRRVLMAYRVDGPDIVREYQAAMPEYDSAAVYVLDRAVYRIGADGSVLMVVHTIAHLKTDEAVEKHGELHLPGGASLLTARTIKADGRVLEPEEVAGKPSLSMPDLEPGDFVESEYILYFLPNQIFPGGFDTERFYFKDFETAFHRSEIVVITPVGMDVALDPRGPCPAPTEEVTGGLRVLTWRAVDAAPHPEEPLSPNATEYLPSIRVTAEATWENVFRRVEDTLADKGRLSWVVEEAVAQATRGLSPEAHERRRRAIYYWVLDNIEPGGDMFEEASHIIASKRGDRSRAFTAMLKAAGYKSRLALVHPSGGDDTEDALPSLKLFDELIVQVANDGMIHLGQEYASYGYLPPQLRSRPVVFIDTVQQTRIGTGTISHDSQFVDIALSLGPDGTASGSVRETLQGATAVQWRQGLESNDASELQRMFQGAYLATAIPGAVLTDLRILEKENRNVPLVIEYDVVIPGFAKKSGNLLRVEAPFKTELRKRTGGLPMRTTPLVLAMHADKSVDLRLTLPEGMAVVLGDDFTEAVSSAWGEARREHAVSEGRARLKYRTLLDVDRVSPAQYVKFLLFARKVDRISNLDFKLSATDSGEAETVESLGPEAAGE